MEGQRAKFQMPLPELHTGDPLDQAGDAVDWRITETDRQFVFDMPMKTCVHCEALHRTGICQYGKTVRNQLFKAIADDRVEWQGAIRAGLAAPETLEGHRASIDRAITSKLTKFASPDLNGILYCYYAHEIDTLVSIGDERVVPEQRAIAGALLRSLVIKRT